MNYKYFFMVSGGENNSVLSEQEHKHVQGVIDNGGGLISLRGGTLGFHTTSIKLFRPTDEATEKQEIETLKQLPEASNEMIREKGAEYLKENHQAFYQKMGWEHKADCICKK